MMKRRLMLRRRSRRNTGRKRIMILAGICIIFVVSGMFMKNAGLAGNTVTEAQKWSYIQANQDLYPEIMLDALERNDELLDFAVAYPSVDHTAQGKVTRKERRESCPLFLQWDPRWGYVDYGSNVIGTTGCGPTCLAMVIIGLTGNSTASPDYLAKEAESKGYYVSGQGTAWSFLVDEPQLFGLQAEQYAEMDESELKRNLDEGSLIICSMGPGDFTDKGHFIVICDRAEEGFVVHDPFSRRNSELLWDYSTLESQWKQLWIYSKSKKM